MVTAFQNVVVCRPAGGRRWLLEQSLSADRTPGRDDDLLARDGDGCRQRRLESADGFNAATREACVRNITRVAGEHADQLLVFENHDGASSRPDVCRAILDDVSRPNVRLTFDAINFEHRGVLTADALALLQPWVAHVHLKGDDRSSRRDGSPAGTFCGFGEGDVDLTPTLRTLIRGGYTGALTVEYEGDGDRTLRLYDSVGRARAAIQALTTGA